MIEVYSYSIKLIDPLFFAREGISGAFTAPYLHATAINHAVTWTMGVGRPDQSYLIGEWNGHRNEPHYKNSKIEENFYFTPARLIKSVNYYTEVAKGDGERFIQVGYGAAKINGISVGRNEVLKAYKLYSIASESVFEGYLYTKIDIGLFPKLIRLGSFRSLAVLEMKKKYKILGKEKNKCCDHPVDPLVHKPIMGMLVPLLPYPIVENAVLETAWEIRKYGKRKFVAALVELWQDRKKADIGVTSIF